MVYDRKNLLNEEEKKLLKFKGGFELSDIPEGTFSKTIMKKLKSGKDRSTITVRRSQVHLYSFVGVKITDLEERKIIDENFRSLEKELGLLIKEPVVIKYIVVKNRVENYYQFMRI